MVKPIGVGRLAVEESKAQGYIEWVPPLFDLACVCMCPTKIDIFDQRKI